MSQTSAPRETEPAGDLALSDSERIFAARVAGVLRESAAVPDADTAARLAAIRRHALADEPRQRPARGWIPALAAAASVAAIALLLVSRGPGTGPAADPDALLADDVELLLLSAEQELSPEVYEELEFYAWLAMAPPSGMADGSG